MRQKFSILILICFLLTVAGGWSQTALAQTGTPPSPAKKTVLVLFPFQPDLAQTTLAIQAIQAEFGRATDLSLDVYYEYMDLNRFPDEAYQQQLLSLYQTKYGQKQVDLVLVASEATLDFWLAHRAKILPDAPVVFYDISPKYRDTRQLSPDITGISAEADYTQAVSWIFQTLPAINRLVMVHGAGKVEQRFIQQIDDEITAAVSEKAQVDDWGNLPLAEIKQQAAALPPNTVVFYTPMFEDAAGNKHRPIDALKQLAEVSAVPVISSYDQFIGAGTIGGYMYSIEQQARLAAQLGLRILRGESASAIPIVTDQGNRFIFDHPALQRYSIPLSALPPESIIKNRQYSVWEIYRPQLMAVGAGFTGLILLVSFLVVLNRQLHTTRRELKQMNAHLEEQIQSRTFELSQVNHQLEHDIAARIQTEEALRASETRYQLLTDAAPLAVIVIDLDTAEVVYLNPLAAVLFETTTIEAIGAKAVDYYVDPAERQQLLQQLTGQGYVNDFEVRLRKKSGQEFWASITATLSVFEERPAIHAVYLDISARKRMEETLRQNEERFRVIFESSAIGLALQDADLKLLLMNPAMEQFMGRSADEFRRIGVQALSHPDDWEMDNRLLAEVRAGRQRHYSLEKRYLRPDGQIVWGRLTLSGIYDTAGNITHSIAMVEDISSRKQAEEALLKSRRLLNEMGHLANVGGWEVDIATMTQVWTEEVYRIHEVDPATYQPTVSGGIDFYAPTSRSIIEQALQRAITDGEVFDLELEFITARGNRRWVQAMGKTDLENSRIFGAIQDITARKEAAEALRRSESQYRLLAENMVDVVWILNPAGQFTYVSPSVERLRGYTPEEVMTQSSAEALTPASLQVMHQAILEIMPYLQGGAQNFTLEPKAYDLEQPRKDGTTVWTEALVRTLFDDHGDFSGFLGVSRDITARREVEQALLRYAEELAAQNAELDAFAHTVAHDLKNPLAIIIGYADILAESHETIPPTQLREIMADIFRTGEKLNRIIEELLLLAGVRKRTIKPHPIAMQTVVAETLHRLHRQIQETQATVITPPEDSWPPTLGYAPWIEEVWANYLSNGLKYGGNPPRLELGANTLPDGRVRFWVRDNGPGLSVAAREKLFVPFARLDQIRAQGHGLGLSIVSRIMSKLGGEAGVESQVGQGSLFYFILPGVE